MGGIKERNKERTKGVIAGLFQLSVWAAVTEVNTRVRGKRERGREGRGIERKEKEAVPKGDPQ